jgi:adenosylcobinamide-GDP ribazoletransferase
MRRFLSAVSFLTLIPAGPGGAFDERLPARSLAFFSIVGCLFGCVLAVIAAALIRVMSPLAASALTTAAWTLMSGALHLDGLADTVDGFGGGKDKRRRLAIMKDSRIGTFGAAAVCLVLMLKMALISELAGGSAAAFILSIGALPSALVLAPVMGRTVMALAVVLFPAAGKKGLGASFKANSRAVDGIVCAIMALLIAFLLRGPWGLLLSVGIGAAGLGAGFALCRGLGGLTGDTYGALCEGTEVLSLLVGILG